jgi:TP901 family phage tail tape measure protein
MAVQINVAANQAALTASIQAGVQAYNQRFAQNNQLNLTVNQRAFSQPLGRMTGDVKDFEAALAASNARVIAFGASTAVLGGVIRSFKELASVTIDVEKNLADINRVFGLSTSQLQKFSSELFNVGKQTASTFDDASKAALEFSRQGLKAEDVLTRTKDALTLTRLAGIGTANAVDALTSTVNGFAATGITTTQILNKLVAVEQDYAVGAGDLAEALSRTGQAAQEAGVSLDQLNALVTAAQQSTARGGAVIGNALKTIFTRLQRTETLDQLEAFNIAVRDVQGNTLPAVTVLQNFAGAYKNLGDAQRAQLSEQVAGVYQVNILKAIVGDLNKSQGVYAGALQRGAAATNEAEVATAKLNQTLDALLKQTAVSTQQLANNIGKVTFEPLAKYGTEQLKSFVESMNEVLEGEGVGSTFANGLLKGIRNVIAGPGAIAAFFTLFKLIQNSFTYLAQALPQIAGITTETQNRKNIEQSILQIMQQQGPVSQALAGTMGNQAAQAQLLLQVARQQTAEYQMQTTLAKQLAVQLAGQGVRVKGSGGLQVTRAGGYIPAATRMAEVVGAQAGGYAPGRVVSSPVGGVMNTAEDVKYISGFAQPFINPPAGSKAGRAHRQNAISRTGVDPYMNDGFIPNFANKQFIDDKGEVIKGKKPNKTRESYTVRLTDYNPINLKADEDLDLKRNLVDSGYYNDNVKDPKTNKIIHYHGERNKIYDKLSGNLKVIKYLEKDEVDKATKIAWDGLISGDTKWITDLNITKLGMDKASVETAYLRTSQKLGLTGEDFKFKKEASEKESVAASNTRYKSIRNKKLYKTSEEFKKSLNGDYSNFIGDFYEQLVLKHKNVSGAYQISAGNSDPADLVPKILGSTMYKGIEAKNTSARINDLIAKSIRINVSKMNANTWDKQNDVDFGILPIYQTIGATTSYGGFIPNFSPLIDDNARNKHDFPKGIASLPIPDKAIQNILDRQQKRQMTYLDFDRTLVRTTGDSAYGRVAPEQKKGVLQKMFLNKEARLKDVKGSKLTQFGELLRQKIQQKIIDPGLLGLMTASDETPGMPEYISSIWGIPKRNQVYSAKPGTKEARLASLGVSANGFIPNFATGLSPKVTRLPWLKSFANKEWFNRFPWFNDIDLKNTSQNMDYNPYTGERKLVAGSEMFRELNFLTHGNNKNITTGNSPLFSYLYEEYVRKILNSVTQGGSVLDSEEAGFPMRDKYGNPTKFDPFKAANTAPMDALIRNRAGRIGGIEIKGGTEENWKTKDILKKEQDFEAQNPGSTLGRRTRVYSNMYKGTDFLNKGLLKRVGVDKAKSITNNLISFYASKIAGHESEIASNWKANKGLSGGFVPNFAKELEATAGYGSSIYGELNRNKLSIESMDRGNYPIKDPASKKRSVSNILYSGIIEKAKKIIGKDKDLFITGELLPQDKGLAFPQGLSRVKLAKTAIGNLVDPKGASKKLNKEQLLNLLIDPKQQQYLRDSLLELTTTHSKGFIPNFADPKIKTNSGKDAIESFYRKGSEVEGKKLTGGVIAFPVPQTTDLYSVGSSSVNIPGSGFGVPLYDAVLAEVSKRGAWLTSDRETVSDKARRIWDGYRKLRTGDVKNKKLPIKNWFLDPAFNNGSYEFPMNPQDLLKNKSTWPSENDPVWSLQHAYQFKKSQLDSPVKNKMASGFIPNFAYKQAVMGLEESMSGNKAIFDTKPFPHIRNSSQPTFSSAIADHGGLGNALSDSMRGQKAAGLMNKGFVPNFANNRSFRRRVQRNQGQNQTQNTQSNFNPTQIQSSAEQFAQDALTKINNAYQYIAVFGAAFADVIENVSKSTITTIKSTSSKVQSSIGSLSNNLTSSVSNMSNSGNRFAKFSEGLSKASTAIAILGPTIAGFAEQAVFGNKKRTEMTGTERSLQSALSTGLSAVSTGAGIGAAFGPVGLGIGAAAGALVGFVSALNAAKLSAEDLAEMADNQKQNTQQNVSAGQKYTQAQQEYAKLLASGASSDKLQLASKSLSESFNQITDVKLADELSKTKGGVEALNSVLSKFETDKNVLTAALSFSAGIKGGKTQGSVQLGERVKELKSIGLSEDQLSVLQSFKLEKENIPQFIPPAGLGPGTRINVETVKESSLKTAQQIAENIAKSTIGSKGTVEEVKAFQESILELLLKKDKEEILKELSSGNQFINNIIENARKEGNLLKLRNDLSSSILKQIGEANAQLEQDDFGRKLLDEINNFKFSLAEGILSPLSIATEKLKTQRTKTISEGQDKLTELNLNFAKENQEKFLKLNPSSEVIQSKIRPALEKAQTGDLSGLQAILQESSITGPSPFDPAIINDLKKIYEEFNRSVDKQNRSNVNQLKLTDLQGRVEQIRAKTTEFQATLLQKQIQLLGDQERIEATRKTNSELEIDAIERKMADQGNFLGRGVIGKAESKIALRNETTTKKLVDLEISRSKSAQSDYQSLIEKQQTNLTKMAAQSEFEGRPMQAIGLREQARNIKSIDITNSQTLSQAISQLQQSPFADPTLENERVRTLEKLKTVQNDIVNGKLKEEEITKRLNNEELRNAKRSTSIVYGFKEGFDALRDEADTGLNRLARDTPALFRDGMVNAIKAAVKETDNLGDALLGVAANFLDIISSRLMEVGVSKLISGSGIESLFTAQKGGVVRAQSGMYISGTGSGDKYPALLENGEYVLNRNAVMAMGGPAALDTLNFSAAPRFAAGGQFKNQFDNISSMEANMTEMGLESSPLYKELTDAAKQKADEERRKKLADKQQRAAMIGSLVAAAATVAIGAGISNAASNIKATNAQKLSAKFQATGGAGLNNSELGKLASFQKSGLLGKNFEYIGGTPQTGFGSVFSGPTIGKTWYQKAGSAISKPFRRQAGGLIGSRLSDTIPGYMEGGLYNSPMVKRYGTSMQGGGSSIMAAGNNSSTVNNNTSANNSFNFNTTIQKDGKITMGSNTSSYEQQDIELSKNLNNRIYAAVGEVIRKEKQFGGSLAGVRNS